MQVTVDLKQIMIILVLLALFVLLVFLIILIKNLLPTIKKLSLVMDDAKRITIVAADKTEQISGAIDNAGAKVSNLTGGNGIISKATNLGAGIASAKSIASKFRSDEDKEYLKRARERKADQSKLSQE